MKYQNPVIPGFYPDPSVCRVNEDYYLVTSSFEYFPGVPVFHSRDLIHWRQIGHCLTRDSQLPLENAPSSAGIFAPSIRFHNGWFYMVTTNVSGGGHFYVKAQNPAGPWSEPIGVEGDWFDPDLFFDENGKVYFSHMNMGGIFQFEIDLESGRRISEKRVIWPGFEDRFCEAPHIYKINGWYYLIVAEGGTHRGHMIVAARSKNPDGPYEGCPNNPLLTHRTQLDSPIEHTGHGDLFQAQDGSWWIVFLAVRPRHSYFHLGRETFLAPVTWDEDGWPVINGGHPVTLEMEAPLLPQQPWPALPARDDFDSIQPSLCWNFRRNPDPDTWSLTERPGWLRLKANRETLNGTGAKAFLGRRQQHFNCQVRTLISFEPSSPNQEAGLTILMNDEHHYEIALTVRGGIRTVIVRRRIGDLSAEVAACPAPAGDLLLAINADADQYTFSFGPSTESLTPLASGLARYLSTNVADGFTGAYFGLYAAGQGQPADFDWFSYQEIKPAERP